MSGCTCGAGPVCLLLQRSEKQQKLVAADETPVEQASADGKEQPAAEEDKAALSQLDAFLATQPDQGEAVRRVMGRRSGPY